jgi:hypothetical protein
MNKIHSEVTFLISNFKLCKFDDVGVVVGPEGIKG